MRTGIRVLESEVSEFVLRVKMCASAKAILLVPRKSNLDVLAILGVSLRELENVISDLTEADYISRALSEGTESEAEWFFHGRIGGRNLRLRFSPMNQLTMRVLLELPPRIQSLNPGKED